MIHRLLQYLENSRTVKFKDHKESRHTYISSLKVKRPTTESSYNFTVKEVKIIYSLQQRFKNREANMTKIKAVVSQMYLQKGFHVFLWWCIQQGREET